MWVQLRCPRRHVARRHCAHLLSQMEEIREQYGLDSMSLCSALAMERDRQLGVSKVPR
jgi:hypothetical protein